MAIRSKALIAATLASLVVVTNLAGLLHHATVRHVRCAEHNELLHVDSARPELFELTLTNDAVRSSPAGASNGHHHCGAFLYAREREAVSEVESQIQPISAAAVHVEPAANRAPPGICRYRIAPKTSPPVTRA